jgi:hypothetical protein
VSGLQTGASDSCFVLISILSLILQRRVYLAISLLTFSWLALIVSRSRTMKPLFCSLLLLFTFSQSAQAPEAVPLPKEPHHHLVLENDYVRVFRVSLPAHAATLLHQHDVPYLYVSLGPADVVNAVQGRPEARIVMADGQVGYSPGHFAHIARTDAGSTFDNVTIELLHPQGEVHNLCERIVEGELGECHPFQNRSLSLKQYFKSEEMVVSFGTLKPKAEFTGSPYLDHLLVAMDEAEIEVSFPDPHLGPSHLVRPTKRLGPSDVLWVPANHIEAIRNLRARPSSYVYVLFKGSAANAKH